jgi:ABC-type amino acid transport substrate-binding protein
MVTRRVVQRRRRLRLFLLLLVPLTGCDLPRDSMGTLDRVRGDTLRVGVVASPPYLVRSGEQAAGPEAELVRAFASSVDAAVEWRWGSLDDHMKSLEAFELDLVAAGLTTASPWKRKVGFTRPWRVEGKRKHVLAVPPGENAVLVALEELIEARRRQRP